MKEAFAIKHCLLCMGPCTCFLTKSFSSACFYCPYLHVVIILKSPETIARSGCFCLLETKVTIARLVILTHVLMDLFLLASLNNLKQVTIAFFIFVHVLSCSQPFSSIPSHEKPLYHLARMIHGGRCCNNSFLALKYGN